jgi:hypothetical protein
MVMKTMELVTRLIDSNDVTSFGCNMLFQYPCRQLVDQRTRFDITLHINIYFREFRSPGSSCGLRFSNVSKKYE